MKEQLLTWLNRFLIADVFLVFFGFFWFVDRDCRSLGWHSSRFRSLVQTLATFI